MSTILASARSAKCYRYSLPQELLWTSCIHTSSCYHSPSRNSSRPSKPFYKGKSATAPSPSRKRLVKDLTPRSQTKNAGKLVVAPPPPPVRDQAPHTGAEDRLKLHAEHKLRVRQAVEWKRSRDAKPAETNRGGWHAKEHNLGGYKRKSVASPATDIPDFDQPWRTTRDQLRKPSHRDNSFGIKKDGDSTRDSDSPGDTKTSRKPHVYNPLSDEFDASARSESIRNLPTEFTSPPLMEGLLTSVLDVLGPHARPTPIQALSLKHVVNSPPPSAPASVASTRPSNGDSGPWKQYLLASETGSGKSIAYLLPMLQDLKLSELRPDTARVEEVESGTHPKKRLPLNPRALVLAPTHELARQLSSFSKALLHGIKLRVFCASQANLPSTPKRSATASKMAKEFEALVSTDADGHDMDNTGLAALSKKSARPVDVVVGTSSKILSLIKGRGWDYEQPNIEDTWDKDEHGKSVKPRPFTIGEPQMGLERVEWVVVDEADVLFDPDFQDHTKLILSAISEARGQPIEEPSSITNPEPSSPSPINYPFNLLLSTATIPSALAWYLDTYHPALTRLASPNLHHLPSTLKTEYSSWTGGNRNADIERRLRRVWMEDALKGRDKKSKVLIFCNKNTKVEDLGRYLNEKGVANVALTSSGDMRKRGSNHHLDGFLRERERAVPVSDGEGASSDVAPTLEADGEKAAGISPDDVSEHPHVVITTSLLSRGLDFSPEIKHVFIVDEPRNMVDFLHRAGRSGRAGEQGKVIVFGKTKGRGSSKAKDMRKRVGALVA